MCGGSPSCSPIKHLTRSTWGQALIGNGRRADAARILRSRWSEGIQISAGYKSQGFVPGEQLSGGGSSARASRSGGEAASTEARRAKVDTMSAR